MIEYIGISEQGKARLANHTIDFIRGYINIDGNEYHWWMYISSHDGTDIQLSEILPDHLKEEAALAIEEFIEDTR